MPQININDDAVKISAASSETMTDTQAGGDWKPEEVPQLTVDVYKINSMIYIVSTVAGVNPKDIDISIDNNVLSIKGVRRQPYLESAPHVLLQECFWGEFYRELTINETLDVDKIKASLKQGVLTIEIPILKISASRKIAVDFQ